ncbi:hypothetical protein O181_107841 [Austropuccinia psidii MF-1]|uniref:Uncharacterized protein n=1 Tax=Austropuccinia psidii MF-1 TaxID=1389203 RepID=A0A9Q3JTN5_9BASI|nr:hypothetical protein [Austropuccinia psidii MF-1]
MSHSLLLPNAHPSHRTSIWWFCGDSFFDADYIPTSEIPSELDITALSDHQIKGESLKHLQQIISETIIPSSWTRVPRNMGSPSHGSLKAAEWALLYKVYIPFLILSQQMSLDAHQSANTQRKMGQSEELANELTKNTFHLISAINIATSWTVSIDDATAFADHWKNSAFPINTCSQNRNVNQIIIFLIIFPNSSNFGPSTSLSHMGL